MTGSGGMGAASVFTGPGVIDGSGLGVGKGSGIGVGTDSGAGGIIGVGGGTGGGSGFGTGDIGGIAGFGSGIDVAVLGAGVTGISASGMPPTDPAVTRCGAAIGSGMGGTGAGSMGGIPAVGVGGMGTFVTPGTVFAASLIAFCAASTMSSGI